ncbi:hypothetical protein DICA4_E30526 [Diutina catenulata]
MLQRLIIGISLLASFLALEITDNLYTEGDFTYRDFADDITLKSGVFWSIFDSQHVTFGSMLIEDGASLYVTGLQDELLYITGAGSWTNPEGETVGATVVNHGLVSFQNDYSLTTFLTWQHFENSGTLLFNYHGVVNTIWGQLELIGSDSLTNTGLITFHCSITEEEEGCPAQLYVSNIEGFALNDGDVCLENNWYTGSPLHGHGCMHLRGNSEYDTTRFFDQQVGSQTIQFSPGSQGAFISMKGTFIRGFGEGMAIGVSYAEITQVSYAGTLLTILYDVDGQLETIVHEIGEGYDPDLFSIGTRDTHYLPSGNNNNVIEYHGPVPEEAASAAQCGVCPTEKVEAPMPWDCIGCTEYTTTWTTTDNGFTQTDSGVVIVTTDEEGSLTTTTSVFPQPTCEECTEFTTTWATTDEDGSTNTDSGIIVITTDDQGALTTTTSIFPRPTCEECTEFTTTWTTTEGERTLTESGVVIVTTDGEGALTTTTSLFPQPTCEECTEFTTTWTTTDEIGATQTESGVVIITTDDQGALTTTTSLFPQETCEECTKISSTWTMTGDDMTSTLPECPECTTFTTEWTTTDDEGATVTESGVVIVTTDEEGELTTTTSLFPQWTNTECPECTESTSTIVITEDEVTVTDSDVNVSTDEESELVPTTSVFSSVPIEETTITITRTETNGGGIVETNSGVVIVTTDDDEWVTTTIEMPGKSVTSYEEGDFEGETGHEAGQTVVTVTKTTTDTDGSVTTVTEEIEVTTNEGGQAVTTTREYHPESVYTTTFTTTGSNGQPITEVGVVEVTRGPDGQQTTGIQSLRPVGDDEEPAEEPAEGPGNVTTTEEGAIVATQPGAVHEITTTDENGQVVTIQTTVTDVGLVTTTDSNGAVVTTQRPADSLAGQPGPDGTQQGAPVAPSVVFGDGANISCYSGGLWMLGLFAMLLV